MISFLCAGCGQGIIAADDRQGQDIECPACGHSQECRPDSTMPQFKIGPTADPIPKAPAPIDPRQPPPKRRRSD
jgi:hypothetical protein